MIGNNNISSDDSDSKVTKEPASTKANNYADDNRDIDRVQTPQSVLRTVRSKGAVKYDSDPQTLRDYASNPVVRTYVDTLAKDVASYDWMIKNQDELDKNAMDFLRYGHPSRSFNEVIEATVRDLAEVGNHYWLIHTYKNSDEPAEYIQLDPANVFAVEDDNGMIEKYVLKPQGRNAVDLERDNVVHFKLNVETRNTYSDSFISVSTDVIEILDEIERKEITHLSEGMASGMLTQTDTHPTNPLNDQQWKEIKDYVTEADVGKSHKGIMGKGTWDYVSFEDNYKNLQLRDRYKMFVQVLGAVFKVNPSYVGFDFENTNRATDQSQRASYKQRGIQVVTSKIASKINRMLIPRITDSESKFNWDISTQTDVDDVEYYDKLGTAVNRLREAGVQAELTDDDKIEIIGLNDSERDEKDVDRTPPQVVQENAQAALNMRDEHGNPEDCGTRVGWERANQLANGENLSEDTINRMVSFLSRHLGQLDQDLNELDETDCQRLMIQAWGGKEGLEWAESMQERLEEDEDKSVTKPEVVDECVESVMNENPELSESEAYAICNEQIDVDKSDFETVDLTDKQQEFVNKVDADSLEDAITKLETVHQSRTDAIETWREKLMDGSPSKGTYYSWLEETGLK